MSILVERRDGFLGANSDYERSDIVILGLPMDFTTSWRPGARGGPAKIREVSFSLEEYSAALERSIESVNVADIGDVSLPLGNTERSLEAIREVMEGLVAHGKLPFALGGEHLVTLPCVEAVAGAREDLVVVHVDAHADLRNEYAGQRLSHATVMRRVGEVVGMDNLYQVGVRSGAAEEFLVARGAPHRVDGSVPAAVRTVVEEIGNRPCYVTLDIDVVDPAFAPGTGTPEPGGCSSCEILEAVHLLTQANIVGVDLVEVAPAWDRSDITSLLAAKIVREVVIGVGARLSRKERS
ncbi:MAG: agmatinase [Firmicutes bacterium]|nr:agmatinase [Bacillota bacterium]MDH7494871.1 agmatinase [Bacillota bacterium]